MDPTMAIQPDAAASAKDCPCMQMHQMLSGSPMGWVAGIAVALLIVASIVTLASLSIFLIRRSRSTAAA